MGEKDLDLADEEPGLDEPFKYGGKADSIRSLTVWAFDALGVSKINPFCNFFADAANSPKRQEVMSHITVFTVVERDFSGDGTDMTPSGKLL